MRRPPASPLRSSWLGRTRDNLWLLGSCRDWRTLRAMKQRAPAGRAVEPLHLRPLRSPLLYRPGTTDVSVAWELFRQREYDCTRPWDFRTVVDCGASVGLFLAFAVMRLGPRLARYVGVEADRESFALLVRQAEQLGVAGRAHLLHAAVWEHDGEVGFDDRGPSWGRHVSADGGRRVPALTVESILDSAGIEECDLLKLDIEGGERAVLPRMREFGPRVRRVVAELHGGLDYDWFAAHAARAGFRPFRAGELFRLHPGAVREDVAL